jgi:pseudaminic acid cytidylyltransferase
MSNLCIIPARGGSKRIPGKNLKEFNGKPIIYYTIKKAIESNMFDDIMITTDSKEIAEYARSFGVLVPFIRPANLSDDHTPTADVVLHALSEMSAFFKYQYCCVMYATAPFIRIKDMYSGYKTLVKDSELMGAFTVTTYDFPIFRSLALNENKHLTMVYPEHEMTRSQDLPEVYHDAGQFYWLNVPNFMVEKKMYADPSKPIILPRVLVQDIDTLEDWEKAEVTYKVLKEMKYEI